jgi:enamine deaminase RidA (YjgF/YER057c/UK114 family)
LNEEEKAMQEILQPGDWARPRGYSHGIAVEGSGKTVYIAGQLGTNAQGQIESDDFGQQVGQAFRNIVRVVQEAGGRSSDIVRMTWFITDKSAYKAGGAAIGAAYKDVIGRHFPAITVIFVSGLVEDRAKIEIEATAFING